MKFKQFCSFFGTPGVGIYRDIKGRLPYYVSDWKDGLNYRVIPSTVYMYFTNLLPAIAFAQDMFDKTHNAYGVNEVLMASAMGGIIFGLFAGQPLCIVGVTGPIAIFNYTVYDIIKNRDTPYFPFMACICLWSMGMHWFLAIFNFSNGLKWVTRYSCDAFGLFISIVYLQKGIQICTRQFAEVGDASGYLSIIVGMCIMIFGCATVLIGNHSTFFKGWIRGIFADYGLPLCVVFFSGFVHFGPTLAGTTVQKLPTTKAFQPTDEIRNQPGGHGWFVHFWDLNVGDAFLAIPFAILLTLLFYFDHNVSSLMCQGSEFPLKKPASFHWDLFLLGITTGVAGLLGIPAPNGLIPQAPLHTTSLVVKKEVYIDGEGVTYPVNEETREMVKDSPSSYTLLTINEAVVEQRVSNFAQGLMILGTMSGPLLVVLGLVPQGVLSGLFWCMGLTGVFDNGIVAKIVFIFTDSKYISHENPLSRVRPRNLYLYTALELCAFAAEFGITQCIAAVGFPGVLLLFVLVSYCIPRYIPEPDMSILDQPTAEGVVIENLKTNRRRSTDDEKHSEEVSSRDIQQEVEEEQLHKSV